jgi:hypothetical protein
VIATHVTAMNRRSNIDMPGTPAQVEAELRELLERLNGAERYSFLIWKLPEGKSLYDVGPNDPARKAYMQCAGDFEGRMTCEIRELVDGEPHQYVLGRADEADDDAEGDQVVPWNDHVAKVRPNEVLSGEEVAELFIHYYRTGTEAPGYSRRELDL